jgi:hypothetical protein
MPFFRGNWRRMQTVSFRRFLILAALVASPRFAAAQFTTFIPPQNKVADSVKQVAAVQQKAQADSVASMQLTNMKTWVDSAAGVAPAPTTAADSLAMARSGTSADSATFRNGARAPETASSLPLLLLAGTLALIFGAVLLGRGPEPREAVLARDARDARDARNRA